MTSKTKKILYIVAAVLILAGAAVGIIYDVMPEKEAVEAENIEVVCDSAVVAEADTTVVEADSVVADTVVAE